MLTAHSLPPHAPLASEPAAPFSALSQSGCRVGSVAPCLHSSSEAFANRFGLQFLIAPLGPPQGPLPHPALSLKVTVPEGRPFCSSTYPHYGATPSTRPRQLFNAKHLTTSPDPV